MEQLVTDYGYLAILIGTFLEGEVILVIGGFLAHRGYLELPFVIAVAFTGTLVGDQLYFYLGRTRGRRFIEKRPRWKVGSDRVFRLLERHEVWLILGFRFLYGIRTVTPFALGLSGISPLRYLILNICGAMIWALVVGTLGYYFGYALEIIIGEIKNYELLVIGALIVLAMLAWVVYRWRGSKQARCSTVADDIE